VYNLSENRKQDEEYKLVDFCETVAVLCRQCLRIKMATVRILTKNKETDVAGMKFLKTAAGYRTAST
jgi:hypothetical protein